MTIIKAPYNFIPVSKKIVNPEWSRHVSQDIPFKDGLSGTMKLKIKAHSPLFVRDGGISDDSLTKKHDPSFSYKDKYYIPGSSIKGMIRNVLEVLSFSEMDIVEDNRYAYRDMTPESKYLKSFQSQKSSAGWLELRDEKYLLHDCGEPGRISHKELDLHSSFKFSEFFSVNGGFKSIDDFHKSARFKYEKFRSQLEQSFEYIGDSAGRKLYKISEQGTKNGTLVFTGQPGPRKQNPNKIWTGHHLEFIFWNSNKEWELENNIIENFFFAYHEDDKNRWSDDWKYWREKLYAGEKIPVFFRKSSNGKVESIGLSYLYKLPYNRSVKECIPHVNHAPDFARTLFGYYTSDKEDSLKGRIHVGHAAAINNVQPGQNTEEVLASPKASYTPNYIRQSFRNGKASKNDYDNGIIAGWKRYPVHKSGIKTNPKPDGTKNDILTKFIPLKEGTEFEFKISYHNLKPVELGALISAITFHQTPETFHSIGMAKPLGYGKINLEILNMDPLPYLKAFEAYMNAQLGYKEPGWHSCPQVTELITMVSDQENRGSSSLEYMKLGIGKGQNDYVEAKKNNEALDLYSSLEGIKIKVAACHIHTADIRNFENKIPADQKLFFIGDSGSMIQGLKQKEFESLKNLLEEKRNEIIADLHRQREMMTKKEAELEKLKEEAEREKRKAEKREQALAGPDFSSIIPNASKAFDDLKKIVTRYICDLHADNNYNRLLKAHPDGLVPPEHRETVLFIISDIIENAGKKEKQKWSKPLEQNANLKKVAEWIGIEILNQLKIN